MKILLGICLGYIICALQAATWPHFERNWLLWCSGLLVVLWVGVGGGFWLAAVMRSGKVADDGADRIAGRRAAREAA